MLWPHRGKPIMIHSVHVSSIDKNSERKAPEKASKWTLSCFVILYYLNSEMDLIR